MSDALILSAALVAAIVLQFRPQKLAGDLVHGLMLPLVLVWVAVREPGLIDNGHLVPSVVLLVAGVLAGVGAGALMAWTSTVWTDASGAAWARGGWVTAAVWAGGALLRLALHGVAALGAVHQGSAAAMLTLAAALLARTSVFVLRAQGAGGPKGAFAAG